MWEQLLSSLPNYSVLSVNVGHILKNGLVPPNLEKPPVERLAGFTDNQDYFINHLYWIYLILFIVLSRLALVSPCSWPAEHLATSRTQFCQRWTGSPPRTSPLRPWAPWASSCWPRPKRSSSSRPPQVPKTKGPWAFKGNSNCVCVECWNSVSAAALKTSCCWMSAACCLNVAHVSVLSNIQIGWKTPSSQSWPTRRQISMAMPSSSVIAKTASPRYGHTTADTRSAETNGNKHIHSQPCVCVQF